MSAPSWYASLVWLPPRAPPAPAPNLATSSCAAASAASAAAARSPPAPSSEVCAHPLASASILGYNVPLPHVQWAPCPLIMLGLQADSGQSLKCTDGAKKGSVKLYRKPSKSASRPRLQEAQEVLVAQPARRLRRLPGSCRRPARHELPHVLAGGHMRRRRRPRVGCRAGSLMRALRRAPALDG